MINVWIAFRNPFPCKDFRNIWVKAGQISKHKSWEIQISHYAFNWLELQLDLNWRQTDHAGPWLSVNVFGYTLDLRISDNRHWDDATNTWEAHNG